MFDFAGAGKAIILMSAIAGVAIVAPFWLMYAAHCFLVVLVDSSTGSADVRWPDEGISDWWWKPLFCGGMLIFWLSVSSVFLGPLALINPWLYAAAACVFLWFAYPVGLMCVMEARSSLAVIHMPLMVRLLGFLPSVLLVGFVSLPLGLAVATLIAVVFVYGAFWAVAAAVVLPPALLLYARCWGRLAWMVLNVKRRRTSEKPPPEAAHTTVLDPWALPPEEPIPEVEVELDEPEPLAPAAPDPWEDEEWAKNPAPYELPPVEQRPADAPPLFSYAEYEKDYRKREEARRARAEGRKPGESRRRRKATLRNAFGADFWPFLVQDRTLRSSLGLGVLTLTLLALLQTVVSLLLQTNG
jgi:hypothetical protein